MNRDPASPAPNRTLSRRTAVKLGAVACAGLAVGAGGSALLTRAAREPGREFHFLTGAEASLVIALCEQIIPRDDLPGATDAGVVHFIDRQLQTRLKRHRATYRRGLAALAAACRAQHGREFEALPAGTQTAFLQQLEAGKVDPKPWGEVSPAEFFRLLVSHTMQGFYGSPIHGGNRGYVSYQVVGLAYPQIIGRNRHAKR